MPASVFEKNVLMDFLLRKKHRKAKMKTSKDKINFFNANAVNADADTEISEWPVEATVSWLRTKIQVQKVESEH